MLHCPVKAPAGSSMATKIAFFAIETIFSNKKPTWWVLASWIRKYASLVRFESQIQSKTVKIKNFKMGAKTGSDAKVETNSLIILHLISLIWKWAYFVKFLSKYPWSFFINQYGRQNRKWCMSAQKTVDMVKFDPPRMKTKLICTSETYLWEK